MRRWTGLVERYDADLATCGRSAGYQEKSVAELERFGSFLRKQRPRVRIEEIGAGHITKYMGRRAAFKAKWTVSGILSVLRCFGRFLMREGLWRTNPLSWMRGPGGLHWKRLPKRIGREQMESLWNELVRKKSAFRRSLWMALVGVLYSTGARRGEALRLDVEDFSPDESTLLIDGRKSGQERKAPLPELVKRCLELYLVERHNLLESLNRTDERALFVNKDGKRAKPGTMHSALKRIGKRCGVDLTFHKFRHSCATDLLEAGASLPAVQELLGHTCLSTTMWYTRLSMSHLHEAVKRHPVNEILGNGGVQ